jgi:hypothetical protein
LVVDQQSHRGRLGVCNGASAVVTSEKIDRWGHAQRAIPAGVPIILSDTWGRSWAAPPKSAAIADGSRLIWAMRTFSVAL